MQQLIIATANAKLLSAVERTLFQAYSATAIVCRSAGELVTIVKQYSEAILILGPLKDSPSIFVARSVPDSWDVILLLSSNAPVPYYVSNIIPVNLPIDKRELIDIISSVEKSSSQSFGSKTTAKKQRSDEDKAIIEQAKRKIMSERGISEGDAHKLLQRYSMNLGITMVDSAKRFLGEN